MKRVITCIVLLVFTLALATGCPDNRGKAIKPDKFEPVPEKGPIGAGAGGGEEAPHAKPVN